MSATEPAPSIAEKVRFWQEQDQINQALIPRVVKLHDTVAEIARQMEGTTTLLAAMESRLRRQTHEEKEKLEQRASQLEQLAEQQADSLSILRKEASDEWISLRRDVERAGLNAADLARRIDEHSLRIETLQKSMNKNYYARHENTCPHKRRQDSHRIRQSKHPGAGHRGSEP